MFFFSLALFAASAIALGTYGLNFGVDFEGGSVLEISFNERPASDEITKVLSGSPIEAVKDLTVTPSGQSVIIKTGELTEEQHQEVITALKSAFPDKQLEEKRFESVGPAVGRELRNKSLVAIVIVLVAIMGYITLAFRKLSGTLSLWAMNLSAVVGLLHDIVIPMGIFALLGHFYNVQISAVFVAAILTILGYTVSDKVVIFDRVRENIIRGGKGNLAETVHKSVMQTLVRSINNTLTVLLSSLAIYLFGGESIRYFALALILGIALGAYSSIFVASPLLVWWSKRK